MVELHGVQTVSEYLTGPDPFQSLPTPAVCSLYLIRFAYVMLFDGWPKTPSLRLGTWLSVLETNRSRRHEDLSHEGSYS